MKIDTQPEPLSRRKFMGTLAQGVVLAGAAALSLRPVGAAERNPFAYDVSRFSKTDPKLIGWDEIGRKQCPVSEARRLAFGPGDTLFVAAGSQVVRFAPEGEPSRFEAGAAVQCVGVASDGTVYVGLQDHIEVFDARGNRRATWETPGPKTWFSSLAVGENDLFAADSGNRVILRYDRNGKLLKRIGAKDPARNVPGFIVPSPNLTVKLHPDGLLRVGNPGRHRIEAYTVDGDFEGSWGVASAAISGFCGCCNPIGIAVLSDGRMVTCEKGLPRVKVLGPDGALESVVAGPESFAANIKACSDPNDCRRGGLDAAVDAQGHIHVLDRVTGEIRAFKPKANA